MTCMICDRPMVYADNRIICDECDTYYTEIAPDVHPKPTLDHLREMHVEYASGWPGVILFAGNEVLSDHETHPN